MTILIFIAAENLSPVDLPSLYEMTGAAGPHLYSWQQTAALRAAKKRSPWAPLL